MQHVTLIIPPSLFLIDERVFVSLGILKVAAVLERSGSHVSVIDCSGISNYEEIIQSYCKDTQSQVFGVTSTTPQLPAAVKIAHIIKETLPNSKIIIGGPHVTGTIAALKKEQKDQSLGRAYKAYQILLEHFDVLVAGDGEESIFYALQPDAPRVIDADNPESLLFLKSENLETYPFPARHLVDIHSYHYKIDDEPAVSLVGQLGCPYACIADDTLLGFPHGLFYPDEIKRPQIDICSEKHIHTLGQSGSMAIVYNGQKECITLSLENGTNISLTPDHPVLCAEREQLIWKNADVIKKNDYVAIRCNTNEINKLVALPPLSIGKKIKHKIITPAFLDEKTAWLIGYLIADGCLPTDNRGAVTFAVKERSADILRSYLLDCFGFCGATYKSNATDKMQNLWIYSRIVRSFFENIIGIDCRNKLHVPLLIRQSPKYVVSSFIQGLLAGDGYFPYGDNHPYLATKNHNFAQEVAHLAEWIGWGAVINYSMPDKNNHRHARVRFCNDSCWHKKHGGHPCITASVPLNNRRIYRSSKSGKLYYRTATKHSPGTLRAFLSELNPYHILLNEQFIYAQVKDIHMPGKRRVFDINNPNNHQFAGSGVNLHNCSFCSMRLSPSFRRVRLRSSDSLVDELRHLYQTYGFKGFYFLDDELNVNKNFLLDLQKIIKLQDELGVAFRLRGFLKSNLFTEPQAKMMKEAGFHNVLIGFESADPRILKNIKKQATVEQNTRCMEIADKFGLKVKALMSVGHAGEKEETIIAVRDWLLQVKPFDFDCTVITVYPSTPYYDYARLYDEKKGVWVYESDNGDRIYSYDVDFTKNTSYYKGLPGEYQSLVYTDYLQPEKIVQMRDWVESDIREKLQIPFYQPMSTVQYEHSMGQGISQKILRSTQINGVIQ